MEDKSERLIPILLVSGIGGLILVGVVVVAFASANRKTGQLVLPGGITYLGPSPTTKPRTQNSPLRPAEPGYAGQAELNDQKSITKGQIYISESAKWVEQKCSVHPCSFLYPESLSLGVFPGDPFDSMTIFWEKTDANKNIFFRVEDLSKIPGQEKYIKGSKKAYAENWWRQYSWKGLSKIESFTNDNDLKGYKATYMALNGKSAEYNHYFLEVPDKSNLVIWISSNLLDDNIIYRIVKTVKWIN